MIRNTHIAAILGAAVIATSTYSFPQSPTATEQTGAAAQAGQAPAAGVPADQQPTKEQLAKLFDVMRIREQLQSMRQIVPSMVAQQIQSAMKQTEASLPAGTKLTPEQREAMQKVMSKYVGKAMDLYPADEMLADMTTIYQQHLSKDDVAGLIKFYSSPPGQHLLDAQPAIAKEYMPMVMGKVSERSKAMTKEMMKEISDTMPAATKPAAKPGPAKPPAE
ncbi:MAG: DUF2059 domain-containing protein [Terracidiphilus sp.]